MLLCIFFFPSILCWSMPRTYALAVFCAGMGVHGKATLWLVASWRDCDHQKPITHISQFSSSSLIHLTFPHYLPATRTLQASRPCVPTSAHVAMRNTSKGRPSPMPTISAASRTSVVGAAPPSSRPSPSSWDTRCHGCKNGCCPACSRMGMSPNSVM